MSESTNFPKPQCIAVNGVELEVFEAGQHNAGNPIVLCHGWPEHAFSWRFQVPALVAAGYHVIIPNQRGYGNSSCPTDVKAYGITQLAGDLTALLDHYGYKDATFIGHDWGAIVVWGLTLLHPSRVSRVINLSVPYLNLGERPWVETMEAVLGAEHYFVQFNREPGVADAVFAEDTARFLRNMYRRGHHGHRPAPRVTLLKLARAETPFGDPVMSDEDLSVFVAAFEKTGFTPGINWYRNFDSNWHLLSKVDPIIKQPTLMIYGEWDAVPQNRKLAEFVPNVDVVTLDCGHWIQQELPDETNRVILSWLEKQTLS
ncbi:alpha/beta hydrolase [Lentibacter algarum]|uniref:alpha/beta fold hydrolase n=1 Tax=Lentibacter algarum TaxID=576131 RepID=UPI001C069A02|nr:alpha/beta hydrolase [Lentibacter algarum]MBU2981224.1 alpha/beta hydrolase [Lentibacter algarum]